MHVLIDLGHAFREGFFMFWATLSALVLGFALSCGAVQAFVSRSEMQRLLGRGGPREIARASVLGAASSSCSYAAAALAKTPFHAGQTYHFCSDGCRERFEAAPGRYDARVPEPVRS